MRGVAGHEQAQRGRDAIEAALSAHRKPERDGHVLAEHVGWIDVVARAQERKLERAHAAERFLADHAEEDGAGPKRGAPRSSHDAG